MSKFPLERALTYDESSAVATVNRHGERTITVSAIYNEGAGYSSASVNQFDILTAAELINQLKAAIDAHYVDSITPKSPKDVL